MMEKASLRWAKNWDQRGLTLIEILVCCGILMVMAVILTAAFQGVRKKAFIPGDLNNYRQIGSAYMSYLGDNNYVMPPVNMPNKYTHDYLAEQMGTTGSLHDPTVGRKGWGVWISPGDTRKPPYLSALRSYAVNYYSGDIVNLGDKSQLSIRYSEINNPARKLFFLPADGLNTDTNAQARFSYAVRPILEGASGWMEIRFYEGDITPALWMDGHASLVTKKYLQDNARALILPKEQPTKN